MAVLVSLLGCTSQPSIEGVAIEPGDSWFDRAGEIRILAISPTNLPEGIPAAALRLLHSRAEVIQPDDWIEVKKDRWRYTPVLNFGPEIWFRLGNSYARLNNHGAAIQSYQQALNRDPRNSKTWHNLGIVQLKLATNTFIEMQNNTNADDPLNRRATDVINAITNLLEQDFGVSSK